ncbi:MAG: Verru_Chthon cassette protein B [Chthoniobacteraceae bacterium]
MDIPKHSGPDFRKTRKSQSAFSLVEVVMAIGVVAFAFISVLGLIPTGLNTFKQAVDASVGAQIVQRVMNEAEQTDFSVLTSGSTSTISKPMRYFDEQGNELTATNGAIYQVNTRITPSTSISANASYTTVATVIVQIANNPGNQTIKTDPSTNLWSDPRFSITTYSGLVAQNQ